MAGEPLNYNGKLFKLSRGFTIRMEPPRKHIPIFIASLNQKSVEFTAQKADGWLPVMIPVSGLGKAISEFRAIAKTAGRDPKAVEVKAPGAVMVTKNPDRAKAGQAATVAFYAARMGTFYRNSSRVSASATRCARSRRRGTRVARRRAPKRFPKR